VTCYSVLNFCVLFGVLSLSINQLLIKHFTSWFQVYKWKYTVIVFINADKCSKNFTAFQFLSYCWWQILYWLPHLNSSMCNKQWVSKSVDHLGHIITRTNKGAFVHCAVEREAVQNECGGWKDLWKWKR
jgi:hypothetical protein